MRGLELVQVAAGLQPVLDPRPAAGRGSLGGGAGASPGRFALGFMPADIGPARRTLSDVRREWPDDERGASALATGRAWPGTPDCSASATSRERFWFCGRCSMPKRWKSERRCDFTASTQRCSSPAMSWFVAGTANSSCLYGRARATSTWRWVGGRSPSVSRSPAIWVGWESSAVGALVGDRGLPDADDVAVAQAVAAADALAVDVGAVARQAVVGDRPLPADALELGVQARDLRVPRQAHLVGGPAAHADAVAVGVEVDDPLLAVPVAEDEERPAAALGLDPLAQLGGRRAVGLQGRGGSAHLVRSRYPRVRRTPPRGPNPPPGVAGSGSAPGAPLRYDDAPPPPDRLPQRLRRAARGPRPRRRRPCVRRHPRPLRGPAAGVRAPAPRRRAPRRGGGRPGRVRPRAPGPALRRPRDGAQGVALHDRPQPGARRPAPSGPHDRHRAARADAAATPAPTRASASSAPRSSTRSSRASRGCPSASAPPSSCTRWAAPRTTRSPGASTSRPAARRRSSPARAPAWRQARAAGAPDQARPRRPARARRGVGSRKTCADRRHLAAQLLLEVSAAMRSTSSPLEVVVDVDVGGDEDLVGREDHREEVAHGHDAGMASEDALDRPALLRLGGLPDQQLVRLVAEADRDDRRAARRSRATRRRPSGGRR